jgi:hypothetical protein
LQFLPSHCFETYSDKCYGEEKLTAQLGKALRSTHDERNNRFLFLKLYTRQPGSKFLENTLKLLEKLAMLEQCGQTKAALESPA